MFYYIVRSINLISTKMFFFLYGFMIKTLFCVFSNSPALSITKPCKLNLFAFNVVIHQYVVTLQCHFLCFLLSADAQGITLSTGQSNIVNMCKFKNVKFISNRMHFGRRFFITSVPVLHFVLLSLLILT